MAWGYLFIAAVFEIGWAVGLKYSQGFTKLWPSVFTLLSMVASMSLLAVAVRTIPIGTGYAVWEIASEQVASRPVHQPQNHETHQKHAWRCKSCDIFRSSKPIAFC